MLRLTGERAVRRPSDCNTSLPRQHWPISHNPAVLAAPFLQQSLKFHTACLQFPGSAKGSAQPTRYGAVMGTIRRASTAWLLLCMAASLAGCGATRAQRQIQQAEGTMTEAREQAKTCVAAIRAKPKYEVLLPHLPDPNTNQFTMAQLTNERLPSPGAARLMASRYDELGSCRTQFLNSVANARPDLVPVFAKAYTEGSAIVASLVERKITWAESARREQVVVSDLRQKAADADRQWFADLNAPHQ
jgi:hypothetical protein